MRLKEIFKKVLKEQDFSEEAQELSQVLSNYRTDERNLIYRAESNIVDAWREREIRKDRKPRDTGEFTDAVISELEDHIYTQYPKRSQSKFGVTKEYTDKLEMYANHNYIVFPHKSADIASLDIDSFTAYFEDATQNIKNSSNRFYHEKENIDLPDVVEKFLNIVNEPKPTEDLNMGWIGKNWKKAKKAIKKRKADSRTLSRDEAYIVSELELFIKRVGQYFDDLEMNVEPYSAEVIFDGPSYLLINTTFFEDYFVWSDNSWKVNV